MPGRNRSEGPSLESDSFLDVVANIVGILIILIVIVGARVGQSAATPEESAAVTEATPPIVPLVAPRPVIVRVPAELVKPIALSPELLAAIEAADADTARLRDAESRLAAEASVAEASLAALTTSASDISAREAELARRLATIQGREAATNAELDGLRSTLAGLGRQISDVPSEKVTLLKHRLNPIGREVEGQELHFRLASNRVSRVPITELIDRLKPEIERQKDWIARYRKHQGRVGPVQGFSMEYVVERQSAGVLDEVRYGMQMMRIGVTGWRMTPEPDLVAESVEAALGSDSRFVAALRLAEPHSTLTLWVYPDSFEAYRRLREFAYAEGFEVAARPLPEGVPIAGSPNGSRSSSQ